jgi:tetratricopeptide (TPR) repeat protein
MPDPASIDPQEAFALAQHRERFARDPRDRAAYEALEEHHYLRGEWAELERLYRHRLSAAREDGDTAGQARLWVRLGQAAERAGDPEAARERYAEAARCCPGHRPALASLRRLHAQRGEWELVLQIAEVELQGSLSRRERAALHQECGELWSRHAGDLDQALCHFRLALADDPGAGAAAAGAARALEGLDRPEEAIEAWRQAADALSGAERAAANVARARLVELHADDASAAALYRAALSDDPDRREALTALTNLAARAGDWDEVRALQTRRFELADEAGEQARIAFGAARARIEHAADAAGALPWLRRALERREADGAPGARRLLELAVDGGRVAQRVGQLAEAARLYELAVALDGRHPQALSGLAETRFALGELEAATDASQARLALDEEDDERTLHVAIASARLESRGQIEDALAGYREVLAADPGHDAARAGAARILEEQGRFAEAASLVDEWAARCDDPRLRAERLTRAAELARDAGEADERVAKRLEEALVRDPECGGGWLLLAGLHYEAGRGDEAMDTARRGLAAIRDPGVRARLLTLRATLLEERGDERAAAGAWAAAAEETPEDPQALSCALHILRRLGEWGTAARVLERVLRRLGEERAERRADLWEELGRLRAGPLEDLDGAVEAYREARATAPDRDDLAEALARLLRHRPHPVEAEPPPTPEPETETGERRRRGLLAGWLSGA